MAPVGPLSLTASEESAKLGLQLRVLNATWPTTLPFFLAECQGRGFLEAKFGQCCEVNAREHHSASRLSNVDLKGNLGDVADAVQAC